MCAIELVSKLIEKAINLCASDIHLEPFVEGLRVRYRIDGVLYNQPAISLDISLQVISRIKVMGYMDISEHRLPQDGKYSGQFSNNCVDIRISTFPTLYGEKVVLRLLDRSQNNLVLEQLGFEDNTIFNLKQISTRLTGLFLVTGPTGSGKTTTLHSMVSYGKSSKKNIVTLEDPIEYHIEDISQSQIHPKIGFTFEKGIRSLLRQDPDVIMVGEIRDRETAQVAIQAALTGHLVLSTLHTTDAVSSLIRLLDMGIEPFLINGALTGVLNQRLVRKLCICSKESNDCLDLDNLKLKSNYVPVGCDNCHNTGYKGRIALGELLMITPNIRKLISKLADYDQLYAEAVGEGMVPLKTQAVNKALDSVLSNEEIIKIFNY